MTGYPYYCPQPDGSVKCLSTPCDFNPKPNLPSINPSLATTVSLGLIFLPIGVSIALLGYRLWKYVIFILGFLTIGVLAAVIAYAQAVVDGGGTDPEVAVLLAFFIGGVCGGFCFIAMYFIVIFCTGCGCGMMVIYIVGTVFLASNPSMANQSSAELIIILAMAGGIFMGIVFVKFQKVCIILATAYLGSSLTWDSIFYGFFQSYDQIIVVELLVIASTAVSFYVQWNYTAKGVDIDPRTGQVTVVVVHGQPAFLHRIDQYARLGPAQPPQATTGVQWPDQQAAAPTNQAQLAWTQPTLAQPLAQQQYQHHQVQQQQGMNAPLIQHVHPGPANPTFQNPSSPATSKAGPLTLTDFCSQNKFGAFEVELAKLGVAEASELEDVTDEQLKAIGFNAIQLKRLRKQIPAASSLGPTAAAAQTNAVVATSQGAGAVDHSVDVSTPHTSSIGGSE